MVENPCKRPAGLCRGRVSFRLSAGDRGGRNEGNETGGKHGDKTGEERGNKSREKRGNESREKRGDKNRGKYRNKGGGEPRGKGGGFLCKAYKRNTVKFDKETKKARKYKNSLLLFVIRNMVKEKKLETFPNSLKRN